MTLYTKDGSYPAELPERIRLSSGKTRTDSSTFTASQISSAGYTAVSAPPTKGEFQHLRWTGTAWQLVDYTDDEIAAIHRQTRDELLKQTDVYALSDVTMSSAMSTYRQGLRDVPQQSGFPGTITWPTHPDDAD